MGRPPKKPADKRDTDIRVRVNALELKVLASAAKRAGLPVSSWVRMIALAEATKK